jgi:Uma2 family endonuclease
MTTDARTDASFFRAEEFAVLPEEEGRRLELSRGRVIREPAPGMGHGRVAARIYQALWRFGEEADLGFAFFDTGFIVAQDPDTVRVPDVAFVTAHRLPRERLPKGFGEGAPDLAVEVVSPSNSASEMQRRALDYLDGGARLVWVADPEARILTVFRSRSDIRILEPEDTLDGGEVLPDLRVVVAELFA